MFSACVESPYPIPTSFGFDWIINANDTNYRLHNDTISYLYWINRGGIIDSSSFQLVFDTSSGTIRDLILDESSNGTQFLGYSYSDSHLELINLRYDSSSIFSPDSQMAAHVKAIAFYCNTEEPSGNPPPQCDRLDYATSIDLLGNFRPSTLTSGIEMRPQAAQDMSLFSSAGMTFCKFAEAAHPRKLELYTELGVKTKEVDVPAGVGEIPLPVVPAGFYLLRMDQSSIKLIVP